MSRRRRRCGVCPKWDRGWCVHLAEMRPPDAPGCDFGLHEMTKKYFREYVSDWRKKRNKQAEG